MDYKALFVKFWQGLQTHAMFLEMEATVEASSWHREANVLVHTNMVCEQYLEIWKDKTDKQMYLGAIAALFHDVGKPEAEEVRESEERGVYRRYAGHEHVSATEFLNHILALEPEVRAEMKLGARDLYVVAWMIENHLPYSMKDVAKRQGLYDTVARYEVVEAFYSLLRADSRGRQSDNHEQKLADVEAWIEEFDKHVQTPGLTVQEFENGKVAYVMIGTSSSGKSTYRDAISDEEEAFMASKPNIFNMDQVRLDTWPSEGTPAEQYQHAYTQSVENKGDFSAAVDKRLNAVFSDDARTVVSDNCNLSKKSRAQFIAKAKQKGFRVVGVLLLTHPKFARKREAERDDRNGVPIWQHFRALSMPSYTTELDGLIVKMPSPNEVPNG